MDAHPEYRKHLLHGTVSETIYTTLFNSKFDTAWSDAPHRVLRNSTVNEWEKAGQAPAGERPGEDETVATDGFGQTVVRYQKVTARSDHQGNIEAMPHWAGQGVGLVTKVQSAGEIVREISEEAQGILERLVVKQT